MGGYLDQAIERLKEFEGSVPWMYLDTVGKVTVGVGSMLSDARMASTLPFAYGARAATLEEVAREFARVSALPKGRAATFYRKANGLRLGEDAIDQRLRGVLEGFEGYLRAHIAEYGGMPDGTKLALLDMVYNLGPGRLFQEYPKLIAAVESGDWRGAAAACARKGPSAARNNWTKEQFAEAAEQFAEAAKQVAIRAEAAVESGSWAWVPVLFAAAGGLALVLARSGRAARSPAE